MPFKVKVPLIVSVLFLLISVSVIIAIAYIQIHHERALSPGLKYGIVLDAGSSRTTVYVYQWPAEKENNTGVVSQTFKCNVNGLGISSFANEPEKVAENINLCMQKVKDVIPVNQQNSTPAYLGATAGMRLLRLKNESAAQGVLISIENYFKTQPFDFRGAHIITGLEEGVYGWITVNYLLGNFLEKNIWSMWVHPDGADTTGALDLGGASTQISFIPEKSDQNPNSTVEVTLYGYKYNVYTHSFQCYGRDESEKRLLASLAQEVVNEFPPSSMVFNGTFSQMALHQLYQEDPGRKVPGDLTSDTNGCQGVVAESPPIVGLVMESALDSSCTIENTIKTIVQHLGTIKGSTGKRYVENPCYPQNYKVNLTMSHIFGSLCSAPYRPANYSPDQLINLMGTGNPAQCLEKVSSLFNFTACHGEQDCSFDGVYQPMVKGKFAAFSGFYYTANALNLSGNFQLNEFNASMTSFCATEWSKLPQILSKFDEKYARSYCFSANYIYYLLVHGYKFDIESWPLIQFQKEVGNSSIAWSLGYMLNLTNMIPAESPLILLPMRPTVFAGLLFLFAAISLLCLIFLVVLLLRACKDKNVLLVELGTVRNKNADKGN